MSARLVRLVVFLKEESILILIEKNDESHESRPASVLVKMGCGALWARLVSTKNDESHESVPQGHVGCVL